MSTRASVAGRIGWVLVKWTCLIALGWGSFQLATVALSPAGRPYLMHAATLGALGLALGTLALGGWREVREGTSR